MNKEGYFGQFGGKFVPETLIAPLEELARTYNKLKKDVSFKKELNCLLKEFAGRPTPLYFSRKLSAYCGCGIYLKREDLCHTGAHKINNAIGQALVAAKLGKKRIIAETGAGQHGVAAATASALVGIKCRVFMGAEDIIRQAENVSRMRMLGAEVVPVNEGSRTLKEAVNAAIREWVSEPEKTYYMLGSCVGPHPYPLIIRDFQSVIGREAKKQLKKRPTHLVACVGGGSNSIGLFYPFFNEKRVKLIGVEACGAASLARGRVGILHGAKSYLLYDRDGQIKQTHSIAPGLDYSGVGPEHSYFKDIKRASYYTVNDNEAVKAFRWIMKNEGIIPALESSHAIAWIMKNKWKKSDTVIVCLSGRGEKDLNTVRGAGSAES